MVITDRCYSGTASHVTFKASWLTNTSTSESNGTCTYFFPCCGSSNWLTTSNFEETRPFGFYYNGHFFKEKKAYLNYKSSIESREACKFLRLDNRSKFDKNFEFDIPLIRKIQFRGPSLKIRCEQKRKMRLHKNK